MLATSLSSGEIGLKQKSPQMTASIASANGLINNKTTPIFEQNHSGSKRKKFRLQQKSNRQIAKHNQKQQMMGA